MFAAEQTETAGKPAVGMLSAVKSRLKYGVCTLNLSRTGGRHAVNCQTVTAAAALMYLRHMPPKQGDGLGAQNNNDAERNGIRGHLQQFLCSSSGHTFVS